MSYFGENFGHVYAEVAPLERLTASLDGWIFTPEENTTGLKIQHLKCISAQNGAHTYYIRNGDSSVDKRFGYQVEVGDVFKGIYVPAGQGVYMTASAGGNNVHIIYDVD